jgi:glycine betaine/proline transport system ATP-binding protein
VLVAEKLINYQKLHPNQILRIEKLTKIYGSHISEAITLLKAGKTKEEIVKATNSVIGVYNVSLNVAEGEFFVIMGLSGSGKSTLLRCLNRLIEPTAGEIWLDNDPILKLDKKSLQKLRQRRISMVFQQFALFPHRTVLENVAYGLEVQKIKKAERLAQAEKSLQLVGLSGWENKYPSQLSGGMQQRVGLARALCNDPEILLMDEPFSALDPLTREEMQDELIYLQKQMKKTIIFITHDLYEALKISDRIAFMLNGEIVQIGTPKEIVAEPATEYVHKFVNNILKNNETFSSVEKQITAR